MARQNFADRKIRTSEWRGNRRILSEDSFRQTLALENSRSERTRRSFALLVLEFARYSGAAPGDAPWDQVFSILHATTRESDVTGWIERSFAAGILLTEVGPDDALEATRARISAALEAALPAAQFSRIRLAVDERPQAVRPVASAPAAADQSLQLTSDITA